MMLHRIHEDTGVQIPTVLVSSWKEMTCNAFFYLLVHAQPSSRLQQMVPQGDQFSLESAAEGLFTMWKVFVSDPDQRKEWANEFLRWCLKREDKVVEEAMRKGMEGDIGGGVPPASGARGVPPAPGPCGTSSHAGAGAPRTRVLLRQDTEEEYLRLKKKKEIWEMKVELATMQHRAQSGEEESAWGTADERSRCRAGEPSRERRRRVRRNCSKCNDQCASRATQFQKESGTRFSSAGRSETSRIRRPDHDRFHAHGSSRF